MQVCHRGTSRPAGGDLPAVRQKPVSAAEAEAKAEAEAEAEADAEAEGEAKAKAAAAAEVEAQAEGKAEYSSRVFSSFDHGLSARG